MKFCRECRDAETFEIPAQVYVFGMRLLENGKKVPYKGAVCDAHLEVIQEDTEIIELKKIEG